MQYLIGNYPMQTTAAPTKVAVSTIKTLLQVKGLIPFRVVEWGFSGDASTPATPGVVELIETDVAATVTAYVNADLTKYDAEAALFGDPTATLIDVGTAKSGYTASVEGSITVVRNLAGPQLIAPTNEFIYQSPLGYRGFVQAGKFLRIRATFGASVNILCYLIVEF